MWNGGMWNIEMRNVEWKNETKIWAEISDNNT